MASRLYDYNLANIVGASQRVDAMGRRITVQSCNLDSIDVRINDASAVIRMRPGQTFTMPDGQFFRDVVLVNRSGSFCTGEVFIGDGQLSDNAVSGTVYSQSIESARVVADVCFSSAMSMTAAANLPAVQLFAKSGNLRRAAVRRVMVSASTAQSVGLYRYSAQLASVSAAPVPYSLFSQSAGWVASGELEFRYEELPATVGSMIGLVLVPANGAAVFDLEQPAVLDPGYGLMVIGNGAASKINVTMTGYMLT